MNKKTKVLLALLSAATISAGAFGLAACGKKSKQVNDETYYAEYQTYVEGRKKAKENYLGYEEWLSIKLFQEAGGNAGASSAWLTGTAAPAATDGKDGDFYLNTNDFKVYSKKNGAWAELGTIKGEDGNSEAGVGVESVAYADGKLVLTLTNGQTKEVELPSEITHKHAYNDEEVITLIEPGADYDGVGYKVCTEDGCEHIELVVLTKRYLVKVVDLLGNPVAGAEIKINGVVETTDESGYASIYGYGYKNDYVIGVKKEGLVVASDARTEDKPLIEILMANQMGTTSIYDEYAGDYGSYVNAGVISEAGVYAVTMECGQDFMGYPSMSSPIVLAPEGEAKKFRVTPATDIVTVYKDSLGYDSLGDSGNVFEKFLLDGETLPFWFSYDQGKLEQHGMQLGDKLTFTILVEELELPEAGGEDFPIAISSGEEITLPAGADGPVYYSFKNTEEEVGKVKFELTGATAEFYNWGFDYGKSAFAKKEVPTAVTAGEPVTLVENDYGFDGASNVQNFVFKVTPTTGAQESKFKLTAVYEEGTLQNPYEITVGTPFEKTTENDNDQIFATLTIEEEGDYSFYLQGCSVIGVVNNIDWIYEEGNPAPEDIVGYFAYMSDKAHLTAGEYYAVIIPNYDNYNCCFSYGFTVKKYNATDDAGKLASAPKAVTITLDGGEGTFQTLTSEAGEITFYEYTATAAGELSVSVDGEAVVCVASNLEEAMEVMGEQTSITVAVGDKALIIVQASPYAEEAAAYTVTVNIGAEVVVPTVAHTITVMNDEDTPAPVAGVTVTLEDSRTHEVIATGVTDATGVVKVAGELPSLKRGIYIVSVSGYDKANYLYEGGSYFNSNMDASYELTLRSKKTTWDFIVSDGDEVIFNGATVQLYNGEDKVAEGTVAEGKVTLSAIMPNGHLEIKATLPADKAENYGLPVDANYIITGSNAGDAEIPIVFLAKQEYSVVVNDVAGLPAAGITVNLTDGGDVLDTAVTTAGGKATFKAVPYEYVLSFENLPEKTCLSDFKLTEDTYDYSLRLSTGDKLANGVTNDWAALQPAMEQKDNTLIVGYNAITNDASLNYYSFTAPNTASYTLSISDTLGKAYIATLSNGSGRYSRENLIVDGRVQTADIILGANRGMNKAYEVTIEMRKGQTLVIGYETDTGMRGAGFVTITKGESSVVDLVEGTNTVVLTNGQATCLFSYTMESYSDPFYSISWEGTGVTIIDSYGNSGYKSGEKLYPDMEYTIVINTDASVTSLDLVVAECEEEEDIPGGGYYPGM